MSNVYLNDFDWYIGRMYMEPHRHCKHKCNDTRRLKWSGVTPKYNFRFADDWVILTSTEREAYRLKKVLTKYFRHRMKLELSQEKTYVTDLRTEGIHFLRSNSKDIVQPMGRISLIGQIIFIDQTAVYA